MSNLQNDIILEDLQARMSELAQLGAISRGDVSDFEQYMANGDLEEAQALVAHLESLYKPDEPFVTDDGLLDLLRGDELDGSLNPIEVNYVGGVDKILVRRV